MICRLCGKTMSVVREGGVDSSSQEIPPIWTCHACGFLMSVGVDGNLSYACYGDEPKKVPTGMMIVQQEDSE